MEERDNIIVLVDEEGKEHNFVVVDVLPVQDNHYAILLPAIEEDSNGEMVDEDEEAFIFRVVDKNGEQSLEEVEGEEEWNLVAEEWENKIRELEEEEEGGHDQ